MSDKTRRTIPLRRQLIGCAMAPLCLAVTNITLAQQDEGLIEEVMVTGSYIRSTSQDEASPVEVLSNDYIVNSGAVDVGELTSKLSVSSGAENTEVLYPNVLMLQDQSIFILDPL